MRYCKGKFVCLLVALFLVVAIFPSYAFSVESNDTTKEILSVEDAINQSLQNNYALTQANLELRRAEIDRDKAAEMLTWIPMGGEVIPAYQAVYNHYQQSQIGFRLAKRKQEAQKARIINEVLSAYSSAVGAEYRTKLLDNNLKYAKEQQRIAKLFESIGLADQSQLIDFEYATKYLQASYSEAQSAYNSNIAKLANLLGKSGDWIPILTSRPTISFYKRNQLSVEISQGLSESDLVWTKEALRDIERSKEPWILPDISSEQQKINLDLSEVQYKQAQKDAREAIEQLYFAIDSLENKIQAAEVNKNKAASEFKVVDLKYDLGMVPEISVNPNEVNYLSAKIKLQNANYELEILRTELMKLKMNFELITGQDIYDISEWDV